MALSSLYVANTNGGKHSHVVIVADSDNYFSDMTKVKTMVDAQAGAPTLTPLKVKVLGANKRRLLVRYKAERPKKGPGPAKMGPAGVGAAAGDVETGGVTITLENPNTTTLIAVEYVEDDGT